MRCSLLVPLMVLVVACSSNEAPPKAKGKRVELVVAERGRPIGGTVVVDDGTVLHVIPTPPTFKGGVAIPADDAGVPIEALGATLDRLMVPRAAKDDAEIPSVPVVLSPSTPSVRVLAIADALWASGRCLGPVGSDRDELVVIGNACVYSITPDLGVAELTVLVQNEQIWLGLTLVNEYQPILALPSGDPDWAKLEYALKEQKRSAFFENRVDLELTADPDIAYARLAIAAMTAQDVGFTAIRLVSPAKASAIPQL